MPWLETSPVEQRERFIRDHQLELYTMAELCTRYGISRKTGYKWLPRVEGSGGRGRVGPRRAAHHGPPRCGISRKTGYKWLARFEDSGRQGLADRSRAPHQCPPRIAPEVAAVICAARRPHPSWGPAKLFAWRAPRPPVRGP